MEGYSAIAGKRRVRCNLCYRRRTKASDQRRGGNRQGQLGSQVSRFLKACDLMQPDCSTCVRLGKKCVYPSKSEYKILSENDKASSRAKHLWRQRAGRPSSPQEGLSKEKHRTEPIGVVTAFALPEHLPAPESLQKTSLSSFSPLRAHAVAHLAVQLSGLDMGESPWQRAFALIPGAYVSCPVDSALSLSISALALASLDKAGSQSQAVQTRVAQSLGRNDYGKALALVNVALERPTIESFHYTLYSMWILSLLEAIDPPEHSQWRWTSHVRGAAALLQLHDQGAVSCSPNFADAVVNQIFVQTLMTNLLALESPSLPLHIFASRFKTTTSGNQLVVMMHRTTEICSVLARETQSQRQTPSPLTYTTLSRLILIGQGMDKAFEQWISETPLLWRFQEVDHSDKPNQLPLNDTLPGIWDGRGAPRTKHIYQSPHAAIPLSLYFALRLELIYLLFCATKVCNSTEPALISLLEDQFQQKSFMQMVVTTSQALCRTVGAILDLMSRNSSSNSDSGRLKGMYALYPLRVFSMAVLGDKEVAAALEEREPGLKEWGINLLCYSRRGFSK